MPCRAYIFIKIYQGFVVFLSIVLVVTLMWKWYNHNNKYADDQDVLKAVERWDGKG